MAIKIVLPRAELGGKKAGNGTRFYTASGEEITNVVACQISIMPNEIITATIECEVDSIENLEGIVAEFPNLELGFIEQQVEKHGYKLVKVDGE